MKKLLTALVALCGCQSTHDFRLEDLRQLTPGKSTRQDLDRIFGAREFVVSTTYASTERNCVLPPAPFSFVSWPLFLYTHDQRYEFTAKLDSRDVMTSASLQISEISDTRVLLFFGPNDYTVHLSEAEVELLRELERKGIPVTIAVTPIRCFGGILGWIDVPLEEHLRTEGR